MSRHATRALCQFAPWHFVSLALFIQGRLIDRILAYFWWILVGRPPLLQPWPTQTSRAGYGSRALQTKKKYTYEPGSHNTILKNLHNKVFA